MPHLMIDTPIYPIHCPKCRKDQLVSFFVATWETAVRCQGPRCYESIRLVTQYHRPQLELIAKRLGLVWFGSVHDSFDTTEHREGFQEGWREEMVELGLV